MKKFAYTLTFSPYMNYIKARNRKQAWDLICKAWPEYDCNKVATLNTGG